MPSLKSRVFLGLALGILLVAVAVSARTALTAGGQAKHSDLIAKLPGAQAPWTIKDMDIAGTEEMKKAVSELLNYDQALFREYSDGPRSLSVYVAHWNPRKFHPRLISHHTPDVCWVGAGWTMEQDKTDYAYPVSLAAGPAWPAQYREFTLNGTRTYVLYWHIVDEQLSGYASGPDSRGHSFLGGFLNDLKVGSGEQFFIRLSSNRPWSEWRGDTLFLRVMDTFSPVLADTNR